MHDRAEGGSGRAGVGGGKAGVGRALIRRRQGGGGWPGQGSARGRRGGGGRGFKKGALGATFVRRPFVASKRQLPTLIKATTSYTPYEGLISANQKRRKLVVFYRKLEETIQCYAIIFIT